jgi:riboflavin kinase / FMN adenylyltransferase
MKIIHGINKIVRFPRPVVAIGVFDGVHRGHRAILRAVVRKAKAIKGTSIVLTFWPHPQKEESLYSLEHRLRLFEGLGIGVCVLINLNRGFSGMSAEDFIENILVRRLAPACIYVGSNFRFGRGAKGDVGVLKSHNLRVRAFEVLKNCGRPISSTYIRKVIRQGNLPLAKKLLARPVGILGTVIRGKSLGRKLRFPTANIEAHHEVIPPDGIYAVNVFMGKSKFKGACYIGSRPTFGNGKARNIEVHILNFNKNIYGAHLEIQFIKKIREDKKFSSTVLLAKQIKKDLVLIRSALSSR